MTVAEELREKLLGMARDLTPVSDMALMLDMSVGQLRELLGEETSLGREYRRTIAEVSRSIRRNDIEMAKAGSPTAVEHVLSYLEKLSSDGL